MPGIVLLVSLKNLKNKSILAEEPLLRERRTDKQCATRWSTLKEKCKFLKYLKLFR